MTSAQTKSPAVNSEMDFSFATLSKIMNSSGVTVKSVLLKADGTYLEIHYDSTPKTNHCQKILGGLSPTIIGEYQEIDAILVCGQIQTTTTNLPINKHKLPWPMSILNGTIHGDIFCYRMNENAQNMDLSLAEYKQYISKPMDIKKQRELQAIYDENQKYLESIDSDEENDDRKDEEVDDQMNDAYIREMIVEKVKDGFRTRFGRDPNEEEIERFVHATLKACENSSHLSTVLEEEDDEEDEDYNPSEDEEQEMRDTMKDILSNESSAMDDFEDAVLNLQQLEIHDRQQILEKAHALYVAETGNEPSKTDLATAFSLMNVDDEDPISSSIVPWTVSDIRKELEKKSTTQNSVQKLDKKIKVSYVQSVFADIVSQSDSLPTTLLKAAQRVVLESMQSKVYKNYMCMHKRSPTDDELHAEVIELASKMIGNLSSSYLNLVEDELNRSPVPNVSGSEVEVEVVDEEDGKCADDKILNDTSVDPVVYETKTVVEHIKILTTPVKNRFKSARMDIYFEQPETDKNILNAKKQLAKMQKRGRVVNDDKFDDFFRIDGELSVTDVDVEYEQRVVRKLDMDDVKDVELNVGSVAGVDGNLKNDIFTDV